MPADGAFTAEEIGTGDRATLTPFDHAFLESPPTYEEGGSLSAEAPSAPRLAPSPERRASARRLFLVIAGGALLLLGLALLRALLS